MIQKLMYRIGKTNDEEDLGLDFLDGMSRTVEDRINWVWWYSIFRSSMTNHIEYPGKCKILRKTTSDVFSSKICL